MKIEGWNEFYDGWLACVLMQPDNAAKSAAWRDGYKMAEETGHAAIEVLQQEIRLKHVLVTP